MSKPDYLLSEEDTLIRFTSVNEMLDEDPKYLKEFCEAGIKSFTKFKNEFEEGMRSGDLETLRKAGHRIKPVAQMIGVQQINEYYQEAKTLLNNDESDDVIEASVSNVKNTCDEVIEEFRDQIKML